MLKNPYKQIASSFIVGSKDRFGRSMHTLVHDRSFPGPGAYERDLSMPKIPTMTKSKFNISTSAMSVERLPHNIPVNLRLKQTMYRKSMDLKSYNY